MNDLVNSLVNLVPEKYRGLVIAGSLFLPMLTRWLYALANGRGLFGSFHAVLFGTNTPASPAQPGQPQNIPIKLNLLIAFALLSFFCLVGCASLDRNVYQAEQLAADGAQGGRHTFNVWYAPERQKAIDAGDTNRVLELDNMRDYVRLQVNRVGVALETVDELRLEVSTNSASTNLSALQIAADALPLASSNVTWAVKYFMSGRLTAARVTH